MFIFIIDTAIFFERHKNGVSTNVTLLTGDKFKRIGMVQLAEIRLRGALALVPMLDNPACSKMQRIREIQLTC